MSHSPNPKILVVGTGAVGGFYGGKLDQSGARVSVVCRSDFEVVHSQGITISSCWTDFRFYPGQVLRSAKDFEGKPDYVLVALKVLPEINVTEMIRPVVGPQTTIFLLQNGIDIEPPIAKVFPNNEVISGLAFICVNRTAPGHLHHLDYGRLVLGCFPNGTSKKVQLLQDLFKSSGVPCEVSNNIITERWKKLMWNAPYNSISVLGGGLSTHEIMENPNSISLVKKIMEEVQKTAKSTGHEIPNQTIDSFLEQTKAMKPYKTSMLLDYEAGNSMEVEAILGNPMRIAKQNGIDVPYITCIHSLLTLLNRPKPA